MSTGFTEYTGLAMSCLICKNPASITACSLFRRSICLYYSAILASIERFLDVTPVISQQNTVVPVPSTGNLLLDAASPPRVSASIHLTHFHDAIMPETISLHTVFFQRHQWLKVIVPLTDFVPGCSSFNHANRPTNTFQLVLVFHRSIGGKK